MAVEVTRATCETDLFEDATSWHVDEVEHLHIRGGSGNLGTYPRGAWVSVRQA